MCREVGAGHGTPGALLLLLLLLLRLLLLLLQPHIARQPLLSCPTRAQDSPSTTPPMAEATSAVRTARGIMC